MLCDTCIYKDCETMNCSECKFLRRRRTSYGHIMDICYCDYECHCEGKSISLMSLYNPDTDEYEVGYLIRTVSTDYEYSDVFYIVRKYKNERDAMKRVNYLNGGKYEQM